MKILVALLILGCVVASFGFQSKAIFQQNQKPHTGVANSFGVDVVIQENSTITPNGGGEVPGPGVPR
jgi:hypothetical protein